MRANDFGRPVRWPRAAALGLGTVGGAGVGLMAASVGLLVMDGPSVPAIMMLVVGGSVGGLIVAAGRDTLTGRPLAAVCGVLAGIVVAPSLFVGYRSNRAEEVWAVPKDHPGAAEAVGAWTTADQVVRVRPDLVTAYRTGDGGAAWTWEPPARDTVCAMSTATHGGLGLIGHAPEGEPCRTTAALDLREGATRWAHHDDPGRSSAGPFSRSLALAGDVAVVRDESGWRGLSAVDGRERWRAGGGEGCRPVFVDASRRTVVAVAHCPSGPGKGSGPDSASVRAEALRLDPGTGAVSTRTVLPVRDSGTRYATVSADPLTLWVDEPGARGTRAVLAVDDRGSVRTTVPAEAADHTLLVGGFDVYRGETFAARPLPAAVVVGNLLIAPAVKPGDLRTFRKRQGYSVDYDGRLVAISLDDGTRRWTSDLDDETRGITTGDGSVWVLGRRELFRIDPENGRHLRVLSLYDLDQHAPVGLAVHGDRYLVVAENGTGRQPPVRALRPDFVVF
ncbi:hypothetical protein [Streptomyces sp. cmx-18-6]|uniref:hypothetical protein n=1 Tax=Streptomyces sp. cmx-18-6 TaxID=2790930 RepID=UPI00398098A6